MYEDNKKREKEESEERSINRTFPAFQKLGSFEHVSLHHSENLFAISALADIYKKHVSLQKMMMQSSYDRL